jgi:hypothetical protein
MSLSKSMDLLPVRDRRRKGMTMGSVNKKSTKEKRKQQKKDENVPDDDDRLIRITTEQGKAREKYLRGALDMGLEGEDGNSCSSESGDEENCDSHEENRLGEVDGMEGAEKTTSKQGGNAPIFQVEEDEQQEDVEQYNKETNQEEVGGCDKGERGTGEVCEIQRRNMLC